MLNLREKALNTQTYAEQLQNSVSGDYGRGEWYDAVAESYLEYSQNILAQAYKFTDACTRIDNAVKNLYDFDEQADQKVLYSLRAEVKRI